MSEFKDKGCNLTNSETADSGKQVSGNWSQGLLSASKYSLKSPRGMTPQGICNTSNEISYTKSNGLNVPFYNIAQAQAAPTSAAAPATTIGVGHTVRITGSNYATKQVIPGWVKTRNHTVSRIAGNRALLQEIVSWVNLEDLVLAGTHAHHSESPEKRSIAGPGDGATMSDEGVEPASARQITEGETDLYALIANTNDEEKLKSFAANEFLVTALSWLESSKRNACLDKLYVHITSVKVLKECIKLRFGVDLVGPSDVGKPTLKNKQAVARFASWRKIVEWKPNGAKAVYRCLLLVPPDHWAKINGIMTQNTAARKHEGETMLETGCFSVNYNELTPGKLVSSTNLCDSGDARHDLPLLDTTILHEMAHVIDKDRKYSGRPDFRKISGWKDEGTKPSNIVDAIERYAGANAHDEPLTKEEIAIAKKVAVLLFKERVDNIDKIGPLIADVYEKKNGVRSLPELTTVLKASKLFTHILRSWFTKFPWNHGKQSGLSRQIHESDRDKSWFSFDNTAFDNKISRYQLRDPGEEFAELYATYFAAQPNGKGLKQEHKDWFERQGLHKK